MRFQHRGYGVAQCEVNLTDNCRRDTRLTISTRGAHRRDAVDEFGLPDYPHGLGAISLVHGATLYENSRYDVVPTVHVDQDFIEEVARLDQIGTVIPQVMMRIADGQIRFKGALLRKGKPIVIRRQLIPSLPRERP